jgi:hypothetical protein
MLPGFIVGLVAEWLRRGLQILAPRFDSGRGLHNILNYRNNDHFSLFSPHIGQHPRVPVIADF